MTLPQTSAAFRWRRESWGDALACVALESQAHHLFTTRQLGLHVEDPAHAWELVAASVGASLDDVYRVRQVHGRDVRVVTRADVAAGAATERPEADAIVSAVPGVVLAVQVADCVPLLIVDPRTGATAAIHAGWRGSAAGIVRRTVDVLGSTCGSDPADLLVAIGPSIGPCCYEVGPELVDAFRAAGANDADVDRWFAHHVSHDPRRQDGAHATLRLDLWRASVDQLVAAGVSPDRIYASQLCTQTHSTIFDSYRVAGPRAGRMIAAIKVPRV